MLFKAKSPMARIKNDVRVGTYFKVNKTMPLLYR